MNELLIGVLGIVAMMLLSAFGIPIGVAISGVALFGLWFVTGLDFTSIVAQTLPYSTASHYAFVVVPMFIFMGTVASISGIVTDLYTAAYRWTAGLRGSLFMTTSIASAGFAAVSGSTVVNSAVFTRIALPEMIRFGYNKAVSAGCIAAAGTFAALIPPSLGFVIYGILTGESIGQLLIAGIIPGLLTASIYVASIPFLVRIFPDWAPDPVERFTLVEKLKSLKGLWAILLLIGFVMGGIYAGFMPPSAAGAVGAVGALAIAAIKRAITARELGDSLRQTVSVTASLFIIIIGGLLFTRFLVVSGFIDSINDLVVASNLSKAAFIFFLVALYLVMGMFVDPVSMLAMTIPFIYPIVKTMGLDPIWFGVLVIKLIEVAVITPPVGLNLFAVMAASEGEVKAGQIYRGIIPFVLLEGIVLALLISFPALSTWLPQQMI